MARLAVLALCGLLLVGAATGCSTTQEKAERQQAQAKHILAARAERRRHMHKDDKSKKKHQDGSKKR
jgi:hypothetical protein